MSAPRRFIILKNRKEVQPIVWGNGLHQICNVLERVQEAAKHLRETQPLTDWDIYELVPPRKVGEK